MKYTTDDLADISKFQKRLELKYDTMAMTLVDHLNKMRGLKAFLLVITVILFSISGFILGKCIYTLKWYTILLYTLYGLIILPIGVIVIHELIHIIPMLVFGVKNIRASLELKQYMVLVTAHKVVISDKYFFLIAILPFILINASIIVAMLFVPLAWQYALSVLLAIHTTCCFGDIILIATCKKLGKDIYTWDDFDNRTSYFYQKIS